MKYLKTRVPIDYTDITIRDGHQDVWPQEEDKFDFEQYELPTRFIYSEVVTVTQKTVGAHYLDMSLSHNGYKPGDGGNGGFVDLTITSDYIDHDYRGSINASFLSNDSINIRIEGESERLQLVKVLETALEELKKI
jgi:hypothetical protein